MDTQPATKSDLEGALSPLRQHLQVVGRRIVWQLGSLMIALTALLIAALRL